MTVTARSPRSAPFRPGPNIRVHASVVLGAIALLGLSLLGSGCKKRSPPAPDEPSATPAASAEGAKPKAAPTAPRPPIGPRQMVVPGGGITAMRFGATAQTIERHMQAPCDVKTETRCLYIEQAIDFTLEKGVMVRAKVHRRDRPVPGVPDRTFGTFHGGMAPAIMMGLHRHIVHEEFGAPDRTEAVAAPTGLGLVQRDFYAGLVLEYDKIANGNTVLSAMEVFPAENPATPRPMSSAVSGAADSGAAPPGKAAAPRAPATQPN